MTEVKKETIYVDVDDEITGVIGKIRRSPRKIVALVLPKRATVFQSIVNMKLLKRAADEGKKNIVLITSEPALLPLAGATGLHVAKTLNSKPAIPDSPKAELEAAGVEEVDVDAAKSVGELDDGAPNETIDVDYGSSSDSTTKEKTKPAGKLNKKLKIPNFERFRLLVMLGGAGLVLFIVFLIWAVVVAPKARIILKTDTSDVNTTLDFTASPSTKTFDKAKPILPATVTEDKKTDAQKVPATGQKDNGSKATGTMTLTNCINDGQSHTVPAGSSFSSGSLSFVTNQDITLDPALYSGQSCRSANFGLSKDAAVTASQGGDKYNLSARTYSSSISGIDAYGSNMSGGTTQLVKVVSQSDVDTAKDQLLAKQKDIAVNDLKKQLGDQNMLMLVDSVVAAGLAVSSNPAVGAEGNETTVTINVTFTVMAVARANLKQLIEQDVNKKIDPSTQTIQNQDEGINNAVIKLGDKAGNGDLKVNFQTTITAGPQLDTAAIKKEVAGKKKGEAAELVKRRPGIKDVQIKYSPFWVTTTPKKASKVTVVFEKANGN